MKKAVSPDIPVEIWRLANTTLENERISQEWRRRTDTWRYALARRGMKLLRV